MIIFYYTEKILQQYKYALTNSRQGVNLNPSELIELEYLICIIISIRFITNPHLLK